MTKEFPMPNDQWSRLRGGRISRWGLGIDSSFRPVAIDSSLWFRNSSLISHYGLGISHSTQARNRGSVLIIVMWIAFGLVSVALYFAHSMTYELRASDNRSAGVEAEQAIEGAARYINYVLTTSGTNGVTPNPANYLCEGVLA